MKDSTMLLIAGGALALIFLGIIITRPKSFTGGQESGFKNAEEWEIVYNDQGDIARIIVHRKVNRLG